MLTRASENDDEVVTCYDLAHGNQIWQQRYAAPFIPNPQAVVTRFFPASKGKGPFATPVLHEGYLYTLGVDRVLSCFETQSGALKWRKQFIKQQIPDKLVYECPQCGCSEDGKEFAQAGECSACRMTLGPKGLETTASAGAGNYYGAAASPLIAGKIGIVNIGNLEGGEVIAFEVRTGKEKWRWRGSPPSSSSPVI
ncbi:PQQ-binding-like beta-propeller repeat protein, partial [candidate division KSB1 bacterium]|nr:PQQ-binding-like beta-propeller repeat protein [candidate division KSB1 bacterium]